MTDGPAASPARRLRASVRQLRYPKEYRIAPAAWPAELRAALEGQARRRAEAEANPPTSLAEVQNGAGPDPRALAAAATGLWRLRMKMLQRGTSEPLPEMRQAFRHLESAWDALLDAGIDIQDHDGMPFDTGLSLSVLAFQPTAGLDRERVLETVRPSVYLRDLCIQMGEVIVGTPDEPAPASPAVKPPEEQQPQGQQAPEEERTAP